MATQDSSSADTAQTDGEPGDSSDKPPHEQRQNNKTTTTTTMTNGTTRPPPTPQPNNTNSSNQPAPNTSVPLPPKDAGTYDKQPGFTRGALKKLVEDGSVRPKRASSESDRGSPAPSPTLSDSEWGSQPSTRAPSQAPSRAPSFSTGKAGGKLAMLQPLTPALVAAPAPLAAVKAGTTTGGKSLSTPASPIIQPATPQGDLPALRPKAPSVRSHDGSGGHKFNLKDLIPGGQKLSRKSSQRSTGSHKSDTDRDSVGGGGGPRSTAGDSTVSLTKKYGVCGKLAIGKGATSVVRLAHKWDRTEEKLYAVKEFRKRRKNETEKEYVKKLTAEFCISSTLHHTNIVETVDLVQDDNHNWCEVMEFCPGGDLYGAIKKGGMSPSEVECCFKQILQGVEYLHSQGVAHRDLKPENLFFDTKGHLKIGDYGASTVYRLPWEATIHMSTGLCGSEPYIAPEQFLGKPYDARLVDIWACGIVYYCLHFQELPWRAAQQSDSMYSAYATACASPQAAVSSCPPTINNLNPRACRSLLRSMLEPDPKKRVSIEEVMKHAWIKTIEVCHEADKPKHMHVHAQALAQQQFRD